MKRAKRPKKVSERGKVIKECDRLLLKILKRDRRNEGKCDICGGYSPRIGKFHILSVGAHPKLRFCRDNILLTCWLPCHYKWHHSYKDAKEIHKKIIQLKGEDYENRLLRIEAIQPKHSLFYLKTLLESLRREAG